eukprot:gene10971-12977_t
MVSEVDLSKTAEYWQQNKWAGLFSVEWLIIKDIPNSQLRHIILENNDNKPVTNSRDTQEINSPQGALMLNQFVRMNSIAPTEHAVFDEGVDALMKSVASLRAYVFFYNIEKPDLKWNDDFEVISYGEQMEKRRVKWERNIFADQEGQLTFSLLEACREDK